MSTIIQAFEQAQRAEVEAKSKAMSEYRELLFAIDGNVATLEQRERLNELVKTLGITFRELTEDSQAVEEIKQRAEQLDEARAALGEIPHRDLTKQLHDLDREIAQVVAPLHARKAELIAEWERRAAAEITVREREKSLEESRRRTPRVN